MPAITVKGQIVDGVSGAPLEFATLSIYSRRDSSLVSGGITDLEGKFSISTRPGALYMDAEFIGYEASRFDIPIDRDQVRAGNREIDMGVLSLSTGSIQLEGVEVRAERSETEFSLDKRVFNVGKDLANRGGTAEDILDNVPSVTVDIEGQVSLRGSSGVRMLINGRPSGLIGADNANGLRSIPANMIEKVEVITNPSARYEAEGMAGIINIILKKETGSGFNGALNATGGVPGRAGAGANLNYRKGNLNWFVNYGLNYRSNPGFGYSYQESYRPDETFIQEQDRDSERTGLSNTVRFGIDIIPSDKETITGALSYRRSDEDNFSSLIYSDYIDDYPANLIRRTTRTDDQLEDESDLEYSINYRKEFSSRNHVFRATLSYEDNTETQSSDFLEVAQDFIGVEVADLVQQSYNEEKNGDWLFQIDFERPLGEDHKYEVGMRSTLRDIRNDYLVEELQDGVFINLEGLSNNFIYDENVHAAYAIYGNKINKFSFQLGMRGEYSDVVTELVQTDEINDRDYLNFFPSTHLNYELPANNAIQISYSRRIRRPRFWDLNPFFTFSDSRNTFSGNPNLDPELTDSYEFGHIKYWDNTTISGSFFYRHTEGVIERLLTFNPDGTTNRQPQNLSTRDDYGLELTFQYSGLDWLRLDGNANFFRTQTDGGNVDASLQADDITWFGRMTSRFTFWEGSDLQVRFNYRAPRESTQGRRKAIASLDIGWSKDILNKQGTLTLSIRDVFNSRRYAGTTIGENFFRDSEFRRRNRTANVAFSYRINQKKQRSRGQRGGGGEFEGGGPEFGG